MDCYIYYKSELGHATQIVHSVELLRAELMGKIRHRVQLQRRPICNNGLITWMEIYHDVPEGFEQIINVAVAKSGLPTWILGERRLEYFIHVLD